MVEYRDMNKEQMDKLKGAVMGALSVGLITALYHFTDAIKAIFG